MPATGGLSNEQSQAFLAYSQIELNFVTASGMTMLFAKVPGMKSITGITIKIGAHYSEFHGSSKGACGAPVNANTRVYMEVTRQTGRTTLSGKTEIDPATGDWKINWEKK